MGGRAIFGSLFVLVIACSLTAWAGQAKEPALIFKPALEQINAQTKILVLLPSKLPAEIRESDIKWAQGTVTKTGYAVSLHYEEGCGNACLAAAFEGSSQVFQNLPNIHTVKLASGISAMFRPVSCGVSCAPANLWWEQAGAMYQIQIKLKSTTSYEEQERILLETANSMVAAKNQ